MKKIISKVILAALIASCAPVHANGLSSVWQKHGSALLTSLYMLGSAAVTYACYKDTKAQVEKLKKETPRITTLRDIKLRERQGASDWRGLSVHQKERELAKIDQPLLDHYHAAGRCYQRAVEVPVFLTLLGIAIKWHNYFLCRD